jgi:hypothetical protein
MSYNVMSNLVRFESRNILPTYVDYYVDYSAGVVIVNQVVGLAPT